MNSKALQFLRLVPLGLVLAGGNAPATAQDTGLVRDGTVVRFQAADLVEASGISESRRHPGCFWLENDSGGGPVLYLAGSGGEDLGTVTLNGVENIDWEDLAGFSMKGKPYLLVADVGDNNAKREFVTLYFLPEPDFSTDQKLDLHVPVAWSIKFRYPDGPRDCESVAVDEQQQKIILVSKRTKPPEIYELPLRQEGSEILVAKKIGTTSVPTPRGFLPHPFGGQPTAMDISSDGTKAVILTYSAAFLFPRKPNESWAEALSHKPQVLPHHLLPQAEAIAFSVDGKCIYCTSEGAKARLVKFR